MQSRREESDAYFESKSPPKKKQRVSAIEFEDGSDEESDQLPQTLIVPMGSDDEILSDEDEGETPSRSPQRSNNQTRNQNQINEKHPDLEDRRVRTVVKAIFDPKIPELTLKQLGIPSTSSEGKINWKKRIKKLIKWKEIIKTETLETVEEILQEIQNLLDSNEENKDGKKLLKLSYDYYCQIPTIAPVPTYISNKSELYDKFQTLHVRKFLKKK